MAAESKLPAGSILIEEITITSDLNPQEKWDIKPLVQELSIYESITNPFITADMVVVDALALTTLIPIVGQETVTIKFKTPHPSVLKPVELSLRIVSVENMSRMRARAANYIVHMASPEHLENIKSRIMQSYRQQTISDMVKSIHNDHLLSSRDLKASGTDGQRTIVIPNMSPIKAINFLGREAKSDEFKASNFLYYENCDGFNFTTLEELVSKRRPVIDKYWATIKDYEPESSPNQTGGNGSGGGGRQSTKPYEMLKINHFEFIYLFNADKTASAGGWENTVYFIDPIYSEFTQKEYDYFSNKSEMKRIDNGDFLSQDNTLISAKKSMVNYFMTNTQGSGVDTDQKPDFWHLKIAYQGLIDNVLVEVNIPGDSERRAGDVVDLQFPEFGATKDVEGKVNKYVSGKYLVVGVRHLYNTQGYVCVMQCAKNAYHQPLLPSNPDENLPEENEATIPTQNIVNPLERFSGDVLRAIFPDREKI